MSVEEPIKVKILDSEYRVACPPDEKDSLLTAAEYLNDTMLGIRNTGKVLGVERIAVMAALNISYELLNTQKQTAALESEFNQRLGEMVKQIESSLKSNEPSVAGVQTEN